MNYLKTLLLAGLLALAGLSAYGQGKIVGKVIDGDTNEPLPGANVVLEGTKYGAVTDFDGNFVIEVPAGNYTILISYVGYDKKKLQVKVADGQTVKLGSIKLKPSAEALGEVVIVSVADIAKERETPVAQTTLKAVEIQENIGTKELPEVLNYTPSVYATKRGGGWGDARINVRGFDQRNIAVLINGMPVNDMENGWVYWSNWAGLADVVSAMQVQRGLGASKLAISSVGGTINILTTTSEKQKGGSIGFSIGNDGYMKWLASYSTGLLENGLSASFLLSHTKGDGYVDATQFDGYTWFLGLGYKPNEKLSFMFTATGAPQWHHQRSWAPPLKDYINYGGTPEEPNIRYNSDWGYLKGEVFNWRRNFYHKPIASLNIDYIINDHSKIGAVVYGSWGRGGGTGPIGKINGRKLYSSVFRDENGLYRMDDIYAWNSGESVPDFGPDRQKDAEGYYTNTAWEGFTRRASMNSHDWYGGIANYHNDFSENLSFDIGVDVRTYKGYHYRVVNDLLGGDRYWDNSNVNERETYPYPNDLNPYGVDVNTNSVTIVTGHYVEPTDLVKANPNWNPFIDILGQKKIVYFNVGRVNWLGGFTQLEYKTEKISTFVQAGISRQGFQRIDFFNLPRDVDRDGVAEPRESEWIYLNGGNIKTGINVNLDEKNNVFVNAGYYSKQPLFRAVFPHYTDNMVAKDLINEKVKALEGGYGYHDETWTFKANFYYTIWADKFQYATGYAPGIGKVTGRLYGVMEIHRGIEAELTGRFGKLRTFGMISIGDWYYGKDVYNVEFYDAYDDTELKYIQDTIYLKGVKVGDAAQFTSRLGVKYYFNDNLSVDVNQFYADNLYSRFDAFYFSTPDNKGVLKLPDYSLVDAGVTYKTKIKTWGKLTARFSVNNVFDKIYISESDTNIHEGEYGSTGETFKGIDTGNRVFFGWGRTWKLSLKFRF